MSDASDWFGQFVDEYGLLTPIQPDEFTSDMLLAKLNKEGSVITMSAVQKRIKNLIGQGRVTWRPLSGNKRAYKFVTVKKKK